MANTTHFTCYDGNGNVMALVNATTGEESARYAYGPFAEPLQRTGPMAKLNPIRFSTQYHDDYTGDDKYLFRDLRDGRWLNRDPIGEVGGKNLYGCVVNDAINGSDPVGLCVGSCGTALAVALPGLNNPLPDIHNTACNLLEEKIRGYLTSPQELRAWNRFVAGTAADIELSDREMDSVLGLASKFQAELNRQAQRCKRTHFYWFDKKTAVNDAIGGPWALVLGSVTIQLKTSCACRTLTWEACIFDKYDFDPKWWNTHRSRTAEAQVILTRAAQVVGQCGWKEFYHKGCQYGFKAN